MSEKKYSKVQMIGLAISTTPGDLSPIGDASDDGRYLGLDDPQEDISNRLDFLRKAIKQAYEMRDKSSDVLKVFTIPEFFFRGNKGAYLGDNREIFNTRFDSLKKEFLSQKEFADWLFVFGTLLTSNDEADCNRESAKGLAEVGASLVSVYNRLYQTDSEAVGHQSAYDPPALSKLLKMLDEKDCGDPTEVCTSENLNSSEQSVDDAFATLLSTALKYCDLFANIDVYNCCYIVEGGASQPTVFSVQKRYKSKEDFILKGPVDNYLQTITHYPAISYGPEIQDQHSSAQYSSFTYQGIRFGIEICLDHRSKRLVNAYEQYGGQLVDVQIVVSCGMQILDESIAIVEDGIVFNCDGEYALNDEDDKNGKHYHTMLKIANKTASKQDLADSSKYKCLDCESKKEFYNTDALFPGRTYEIHVYPSLDLPNRK